MTKDLLLTEKCFQTQEIPQDKNCSPKETKEFPRDSFILCYTIKKYQKLSQRSKKRGGTNGTTVSGKMGVAHLRH